MIAENIKMTKEEKKFQLLKMPAERALANLSGQFNLVLLDPPYAKESIVANLEEMQKKTCWQMMLSWFVRRIRRSRFRKISVTCR